MPRSPDIPAPPFTIAGVDEVGRGPLAGPVVAAAVVLDPRRPIDGLDDSKRLGEAERERLDALVRRRSSAWCIASASVAEIDELNILHASLLAMRRAIDGLAHGNGPPPAPPADPWPRDPFEGRPGAPGAAPALVLVDGNRCPASRHPIAAVVGGDARVRCIAAASIIAKVARDRLMRRWHERYPGFGFAAHKGYATRRHRDALERLGATPLHRRSFAPVGAAIGRSRPSLRAAADGGGAARPVPAAAPPEREAVRPTDEPPSPNEP